MGPGIGLHCGMAHFWRILGTLCKNELETAKDKTTAVRTLKHPPLRLFATCQQKKWDIILRRISDEKVEDEQRQLGALEDTFQQIKNTTGLCDVDDIIDR